MGWTHSWKRKTELPAKAFAAAVVDCKKVLALTDVPLAGFNGTGVPLFQNDGIVFNGAGRSHCEPFEIHQTEFDRHGRPEFWSFCKTEHLPYDITVQVCLVILKHHLGEKLIVSSDGKDDDWAKATGICQERLGFGADFRLDRD